MLCAIGGILGGLSTTHHSSTTAPTIFIYDAYEGGIGLSEKAYDLIDKIVTTAQELVQDCSCEKGCPCCIYSPKCGNDNQLLDKQTTRIILSELHKATIVK
jgi:DEAD/DEAH box helicase domain-containing protein